MGEKIDHSKRRLLKEIGRGAVNLTTLGAVGLFLKGPWGYKSSADFKAQIDARKKSYEQLQRGGELFMDIVRRNGRKETVDDEKGRTRIQYVREHMKKGVSLSFAEDPKLNTALNTLWRKEISELAPGIAALESSFDNDSVSPNGALRIFQIVPETAKDFGYSDEDLKFLAKQVSFIDEYFAKTLLTIKNIASAALGRIKITHFKGDDKKFLKYFMVPVLINAYNAGPTRMAEVVNWFAKQISRENVEKKMQEVYPSGYGYDLFDLMRVAARNSKEEGLLERYGDDAALYVPRVYALAELLKKV